MNKIWLVTKWEFFRFFKWKQELVGYLIMAVIFAAIFMVQTWNQVSSQKLFTIGLVGQLDIELDEAYTIKPLDSAMDTDKALDVLAESDYDAILFVDGNSYQLVVAEERSWQKQLQSALTKAHTDKALASLNISQEQYDLIQKPINFDVVNKAEESLGDNIKGLSILALTITVMAVFTSFGFCLTSIVTEKQQRITEQLLTCINHQQWIDGKTFGICLISLKTMFTTCLSFMLIFAAVSVFSGDEFDWSFDVSAILVIQIVLFCLLAIIFWNYVFAGFATLIDDPNHSGKTGVMLLPIVPSMLVFTVMDDPNSTVSYVLSLFPLTSVTFMPLRLSSMEVPLSQYLLSLFFLLIGIWVVRLFATRVFKANITLFGKEPSWGEVWRTMMTNK